MVGYPNRFSSAVIKIDNTAERYRVGETIGSTSYQLAEVYWDHVVLSQGNGSTRELQFKGLPNGLYQPMTPDASQQKCYAISTYRAYEYGPTGIGTSDPADAR